MFGYIKDLFERGNKKKKGGDTSPAMKNGGHKWRFDCISSSNSL